MAKKNDKIFSFEKYWEDVKDKHPTLTNKLTEILKTKDGAPGYDNGFYCYFKGKNKLELDMKFPFPLATNWCISPEHEKIIQIWKEKEDEKNERV